MIEIRYPREMSDWYFRFNWDNRLIWALDVPVETRPFAELGWHLNIPIWTTERGKPLFNLRPMEVIENPGKYPFQDKRIEEADLSFPLDMMFSVDRFVILDGIHRLAKHHLVKSTHVRVRVIPRELIPLFATEGPFDKVEAASR